MEADAEQQAYEPVGVQGSCGQGHGGSEGPESGVYGAHSSSASSTFTSTNGSTRISKTEAHLPHPAGSWEPNGAHPWIHQRQGAVCQDCRGVQHLPLGGNMITKRH